MMHKKRGITPESHSRWRSCSDDIARFQRHERTKESNRRCYRVYHTGIAIVLHFLPIETCYYSKRLWIWNFGCWHDTWPHGGKDVEGCPCCPLTCSCVNVTCT